MIYHGKYKYSLDIEFDLEEEEVAEKYRSDVDSMKIATDEELGPALEELIQENWFANSKVKVRLKSSKWTTRELKT